MTVYITVHRHEIAMTIHGDKDFVIVYYKDWEEFFKNILLSGYNDELRINSSYI